MKKKKMISLFVILFQLICNFIYLFQLSYTEIFLLFPKRSSRSYKETGFNANPHFDRRRDRKL